MGFRTLIRGLILPLVVTLLLGSLAHAQPANSKQRAEVKRTAFSTTGLRPGDKAMMAVELEIKDGFHAQSRKPTDKYAIKFDLKVDKAEGLTFGEPEYPAGKDETYQDGTLNVYTGKVIVQVPVEVKSDAPAGEVKVTGKLRYQICDDKVCYPPENPKFEVKSKIVAKDAEVMPNEPELFKKDEKESGTKESKPESDKDKKSSSAPPAMIFGRELDKNAFLLAFAAAFIVGVVFNVMPCVLPVVPLKIMGFAKAAENSRAKSLAFGAVFSAGLVASFGVLALLIVVLRVIDWGGLFTKWWFIVPMVIVLVAMAVSMFGLFTVNVPTALYNVAPRHDTYVGNFLFGVLTAALSTPCTFGMFVGLLAWALTQPAYIGVSLIMMVGVGMAFPYFVLSAFPELARKFPRGGAWGEVVKQFMGFLLLATAVYFASPLIRFALSQEAVWWCIFATIAAGTVFLLARGVQVSKSIAGRVTAVVIAIAILAPSVYGVRILTSKPFEWTPFTPQALEQAQADGKIALVEFTATWCGNCHYLEATVLKSRTIVEAVREHKVVMLKADVTEDEAPGRPLLNQLSPAGAIPLTAVYAPSSQSPIQLTGIYEKSALKEVLKSASRERVVVAR